jgi:LacI family transcriptional regulator
LKNNVKNLLCVFGDKNLDITKKRENGLLKTLLNNDLKVKKIYAENENQSSDLVMEVILSEEFDAIFAMSDEVLAGLFSAFAKLNISPKDYLITAISNGILPNFLAKNISIVKHDGFEMGKTTAHKILDKIENTTKPRETKYIDISFRDSAV